MIAFDPQTTTIILAACSGLALGVAGMRFADATADQRMIARYKRRARRMLRSDSNDAPWSVPAIERPAPASFVALGLPPGVRTAPPRVPVGGVVSTTSPPPPKMESRAGLGASQSAQNQTPPPLPRVLPGPPGASNGPSERVPRREAGHMPAYIALAVSQPAPVSDDYRPHLQMRAIDHVTEWLSWQRDAHLGRNPKTGRWECRRSHDDVLASYHQWARARSLFKIPAGCFLNLLAEQSGVEKSRDRLKDSHGRVLRNEHGTPRRSYYYTICELPPEPAQVARRKVA